MALVKVLDQQFTAAGSETPWTGYLATSSTGLSADIVSLTRVTSDGDPYIKIVATDAKPFFWDPNHYFPGLGYVNLIAIGYCGAGSSFAFPAGYLISGGKVILTCRVKNFYLPREARLIWWFQNTNGVYFYNYGQTTETIDQQLGFGSLGWGRRVAVEGLVNSGFLDVEVNFPPNDAQWRCYGSSPLRDGVSPGYTGGATIYSCAPRGVAQAMQHPIVDMGVHAMWVNPVIPAIRPVRQIKGEFHLKRVQIFEEQ